MKYVYLPYHHNQFTITFEITNLNYGSNQQYSCQILSSFLARMSLKLDWYPNYHHHNSIFYSMTTSQIIQELEVSLSHYWFGYFKNCHYVSFASTSSIKIAIHIKSKLIQFPIDDNDIIVRYLNIF